MKDSFVDVLGQLICGPLSCCVMRVRSIVAIKFLALRIKNSEGCYLRIG